MAARPAAGTAVRHPARGPADGRPGRRGAAGKARPARRSAWRAALALAALLALRGPGSAAAEPFLDLYAGKSTTRAADVRIRQPALGNDFTVEQVSFDDESFRSPIWYGLRAGYFSRRLPWLGAGLEFVHFKILADTAGTARIRGTRAGSPVDTTARVDTVVQEFDISHGVNYLTVDLLVRYPLLADRERFPGGRLQPYAGAGVGPVIAHAENRVGGVENDERYEIGGLGVQGFVGIRLLLFRHLGLFAEYKLTRSSLEVGIAAGEGRVRETTHHLIGGITVPLPGLR